MVFTTKGNDRTSHWAHIMCDPDYKAWHSIELFPVTRDTKKRAARFGKAQPTEGTCKRPSSFLHVDVDPDM